MTLKEITQEESKAIEELRKRLKGDMDDELYDDTYLFLRFLRARNLNLNNSEAMLRKHLEWRENLDIKNLLDLKRKEVWEKYATNLMIGCDKYGCCIRYCPAGKLDMLGVLKSCTFEEVTKYMTYDMEEETVMLKHQSEKLGRNVDQCIYIANFEKLSFAASTNRKVLHFLSHLVKTFTNNYPERLKAAYVLNVSVYFNLLFSVVKPLVPKTILSKVKIYSDDSYKEDLLKVVDADILPEFLGGNRSNIDGNLAVLKHAGNRVPEKYYLQKGKHLLSKEPNVKKITLSRAAFHEEMIDIKETGSYIEWEFETKCRDIGFDLFYNEFIAGEEEKITEVIPIQRIKTEEYPETGTYRCDKAGKYVIVFNNSCNSERQKEVFIRTKILTPKEHEVQLQD